VCLGKKMHVLMFKVVILQYNEVKENNNVLHVPEMKKNLFFVRNIMDIDVTIMFDKTTHLL
jgi:hypothetical protein